MPCSCAEQLGDLLDVAKRVGENVGVGIGEVAFLPIVFPVLVALGHRIEREVHRSHIERAHFRRKLLRGGDALLDRHGHGAAGGDVDHRVGRLLDARQKLHVDARVRRRAAILGIAGMQVQDRGAGIGGIDRLGRDLIGRDRQRIRHGGRMDRAGDRAADNDFVGHRRFFPFRSNARAADTTKASAVSAVSYPAFADAGHYYRAASTRRHRAARKDRAAGARSHSPSRGTLHIETKISPPETACMLRGFGRCPGPVRAPSSGTPLAGRAQVL